MTDYKVLIGADTSKLVSQIETVTSKKTYDVKVNADGTSLKTLSTQIDTVNATFADGTKGTYSFTSAIKDGEQQVTKMSESTKTLNNNTKSVSTGMASATKETKSFTEQLGHSITKVFEFGLATAVLGAFYQAIQLGKEAIFEFDDSITELIKVTDLGGESLAEYKNEAYELANELKTSATNITDAVTEFSKSGFNLDEALTASESAVKFQTIADEALTAEESASFLIQTLAGFNMTANETERVIDAVNEVNILAFPIRNFRVIKAYYIG